MKAKPRIIIDHLIRIVRSSDFYGSNFALYDLSPPSTSSSSSSPSTISFNDGSSAYSALLRTVLFGPDCGVVSPSTPDGRGSSPSRNIFRFKTESRRPYRSISPYDFDGALPPEGPSVTKLCDLGAGDSVCSVGWAQRGTHLAVGTNNGKVEVLRECNHVNPQDEEEGNIFLNSRTNDEDLMIAQLQKVSSVLIEKAKVNAEHEILEIGCGWGTLAIEVVKRTASPSQRSN
ncbi:Protein FIZZY-RELATED 2 [Acorus gramineus]|uniref:Protein FIZZY-RELATED 2 n=1 Tax=Acorus gramineus TaxID=55184 RepID=A0AAV9BYK3_ACOGR|nr:Protein FIZZY-RELATED 2 [Acorus gramineus]